MNKTTTATRCGSFGNDAVAEISEALHQLLADVFCLYVKTKTFHWHMTGRHFHDYHILLDEHAEEIFKMKTILPSGRENSAGPHCDPLATFHDGSG